MAEMKKGWPKTVMEMNRWELAWFLAGALTQVRPGIAYNQHEIDERRDKAMFHFLLVDKAVCLQIALEFLASENFALDTKIGREDFR